LFPVRLAAAGLCLAAPFAVLADGATTAAGEAHRWHFTVLLDGKPIGWQEWRLSGDPADAEVQVQADLRVTVLRIPFYTYQHTDHERWRGGCLSQIDSRTSDNGQEFTVHGQTSEDAFQVHGAQGPAALHGCIKTFAYWDVATLREHQLLNSQTGAYEAVTVSQQGREDLMVGAQHVPAEHYRLAGSKYTIELWYSPAGEWLGLQTTADGRTVRYEMRP
jgi:Family of unknown function (DUF6134)